MTTETQRATAEDLAWLEARAASDEEIAANNAGLAAEQRPLGYVRQADHSERMATAFRESAARYRRIAATVRVALTPPQPCDEDDLIEVWIRDSEGTLMREWVTPEDADKEQS